LLKICQQLRHKFGDSPEALRDEAFCFEKLAELKEF